MNHVYFVPTVSVGWQWASRLLSGDDAWVHLYAMARCFHHIIANSSFSWWAAYLSSCQWGNGIASGAGDGAAPQAGQGTAALVAAPEVWVGPRGPKARLRDIHLPGWIAVNRSAYRYP